VGALAERYQGKAKVIHMNVDDPAAQPFLNKYNVRGTPTIVLLDRHGHVASNVPGWPGEQQVAQALDTLVAAP
jgi:thioredoxin-like negative regulator of GroEL